MLADRLEEFNGKYVCQLDFVLHVVIGLALHIRGGHVVSQEPVDVDVEGDLLLVELQVGNYVLDSELEGEWDVLVAVLHVMQPPLDFHHYRGEICEQVRVILRQVDEGLLLVVDADFGVEVLYDTVVGLCVQQISVPLLYLSHAAVRSCWS